MTNHIKTCRFCNEWSADPAAMLKYSTRHYAHHECYLDAGKPLETLSRTAIGSFPWKLVRDRGLLPKIEKLYCMTASLKT